MKKRKLALLSLAAVAGLSLASCGGGSEKVEYAENGRVDVHVSYSGKQGISIVKDPFFNTVENQNYVKGNLLPTWKAFAANTETSIYDASAYGQGSDADTYTAVDTAGYKSETAEGEMIDLFYNTNANINKMGAAGKAVDLLQHLDKMPNFKAWLDANPTMKRTITSNGAIYYTPYFDGYQDVERMFVMDTNLAKAVLDAADFSKFDTETTNGGANPSANVLQGGFYQPVINADNNYPDAKTKVKVLNGKKADGSYNVVEIEIAQTTNIIKQQNEKLAAGCTGKELAEQFRAYLDVAFAGLVGEGKVFANYSDIFISDAAAYNSDELIALMRVVKANPGLISGDKNYEIEGLLPRGGANNRVDNIADFMQIWGIQGMTSKREMLYFDGQGNLNDASLTKQTYDGVANLHDIYQEGLIIGDFYMKSDSIGGTYYLNKYFGKSSNEGGYGFMLYDYAASTGASNVKVDGIGTAEDKFIAGFDAVTGVRPILPPLAYWATGSEFKPLEQDLRDLTGKELLRYSEENRSLKSNSWCIPASSDNIDGACKLMDYLFTEEGVRIQDFGPDDGKYWELGTVAGTEAPIMSQAVKDMIGNSSTDFWTFMRQNIGSTHGIGHIRSIAIQIQSCNYYAQIGLNNLEDAIASGVVVANRVDKDTSKNDSGYTWDSTAPTAGYPAVAQETANSYDSITAFWASDKNAQTALGWVAVVTSDKVITTDSKDELGKTKNTQKGYSYSDVMGERDAKISNYLYAMANYLGAVPEYAKPKA